jgi:hypothetical protein
MADEDIKSTRVYAHYYGTVTNNKDPLKLGRVKVHVPGLTHKETHWAIQVGQAGSGSFRKGSYNVPPMGAQVQVGFALGDLDSPYYLSGPYYQDGSQGGGSSVPRVVERQTVDKAPTVVSLVETERFEVYIVDNEDEQRLLIADLNGQNGLEFNLKEGNVRLRAANWLILEGAGVSISGLQVQIQGRTVNPLGSPSI